VHRRPQSHGGTMKQIDEHPLTWFAAGILCGLLILLALLGAI
jgi:formate/nitrite transporter FocA (FNT family)